MGKVDLSSLGGVMSPQNRQKIEDNLNKQKAGERTAGWNQLSAYDQEFRGKKGGLNRKPFKIFTEGERFATSKDYAGGDYGTWFWVNPSECSWRVPVRTTMEQIPGGVIHHEWPSIGIGKQPAQKFDQPIINFTFQSGSLIPNGDKEGGPDPINAALGVEFNKIPAGLGNFYDFLNVLNQPDINPDGSPNYVVIEYVSMIFPSLTLYGFFSQEGVQWSDQADNPLSIPSWGASFVVFRSTPTLFDRSGLDSVYLQSIFGA